MKIIIKSIFLLFFISFITAAQSLPGLYEDAMKAFQQKEYQKAQKLFQQVAEANQDSPELISTAKYYEAESYLLMGETNAALYLYEGFDDTYLLSNYREKVLYRLGTLYLDDRNYVKARSKLLELTNKYRNSINRGSAYYLIGETFYFENKYYDAIDYYNKALENSTTNKFMDHTIFSLGSSYEQIGKYEDAVSHYDEILSFYRESELMPQAQLRIGISYFKQDKLDNAIIELSDPLINNLPEEKQSEAMMILANSFFRLKEYSNAKEIFSELIEKNPDLRDQRDIKFALAKINFQSGQFNDAYDTFIELAESGRDSIAANSLYWAAESKRYMNNHSEAKELYDRFISEYPGNKLSHQVSFNLSSLSYSEEDTEQAMEYLQSALSSDNRSTKARGYSLLGEIKINQKEYSEALEAYENAYNFAEENSELALQSMLGIAIASFYLNDFDRTIEEINRLWEINGSFQREKTNFYTAEAHFAKGDFESALRYYNRINTDDSEVGAQTLYGKAYCYYNLKDYPNAIFYFNQYTGKPSVKHYTDARLRLADSHYGTKNFERASQIYTDVFSSSSQLNDDYMLYQFGQALFYADRSNDAINRFEELQRRFPRSRYADESQYLIGWINFKNSNFNRSINEYKEVIRKYPSSPIVPIAYYSIGDSYFNLGSYDSAVVYYNYLIEDYPNSQYVLDAINGIQYSFIAKDQPEYAIEFLDRYVMLNPRSEIADQILYKKGDTHYSLGEYEKAKESFKEFIDEYPNSSLIPKAYYWIGKSSEMLNQNVDAENNFKVVVDRYLNSDVGIDAVIELGNVYKKNEEYLKAEELYSNALERLENQKRTPEIMFEKGVVLLEQEKTAEAYEVLNEIISYYDGTLFADKAKVELGVLEFNRGGYENAELLFRELGAKRTDDIGAKAQYYYGLTLFEQNKTREAITAFVRVRSIFGGYDEWYTKSLLKLGDCYKELGDKQNAREMYRAVLQRHRGDQLGKEAQTKLNSL